MYRFNIQLKEYNAFRTEALAKIFFEPGNINELRQCFIDYPSEDKLIIGGGCNLFFTKDYDGLIIKPCMYGIREIPHDTDDKEHVFIEASASEDWDRFVDFCVSKGYAGLENLSLIPGTVGASPVQNIGAYGSEVKDCIHEVIALNAETQEVVSFSNSECKFAYRDSIFKREEKYIIISVVFLLNRTFIYTPKYVDLNKELETIETPTIQDVRDAVIKVRERKLPDPKALPNCGSFFKNPYLSEETANIIKQSYPDLPLYPAGEGLLKTSAAYLIDRAGMKGVQIGQIGTYPKQALIVVNYGSANGNDIVFFMKEIQKIVFEKFEIKLEPEVKIL